MCLIKPDLLASHGMSCYGLTDLPGFQYFAIPLQLNTIALAIFLNLLFGACLKNCLPGKVKPIAVVAYVHNLFLSKFLTNVRINTHQNFTAICNGSFTPKVCRKSTEKPDFKRPGCR